MDAVLNDARLECENRWFAGTGGRSEENRPCGFRPAFMDADTRSVYGSCFADGTPAPVHLLDGLPDEVVLTRDPSGRVRAAKASVIAGFVLEGRFFTREEAGRLASAMWG
jgi:hypothetical protein